MKYTVSCTAVRVKQTAGGKGLSLDITLRGGILDGATLELRVYESTPEQRAAFVVGKSYEIDVPDMPGDPVPS